MAMTFGVQMLLIANIAAYVIEYVFHIPLSRFCALRANWWTTFSVWQLVSYQFIHQGFGHLLSNMLGLYFLGPETERTLGTNRFFVLYFLSGVLGGLGWSLLRRLSTPVSGPLRRFSVFWEPMLRSIRIVS